jgi:phosphatidate cytidylyltransferase
MVLAGARARLIVEASSLWISAPLLSLVLLHWNRGASDAFWKLDSPVLLALVPIWAGDTAGYVFGKAFGKRLLAPKVSPNKTVVGAAAFLCTSIGTGWGTSLACGFDPLLGLASGAACGVLGQLGDLFESALKRACGQKDAGKLMPGHGGLLDRIDSLLFAAPAVVALVLLWP